MTIADHHGVYFIHEPLYGGDLWSLSRESHVWLVKSGHNEALAQAVWERETGDYSATRGVSLFNASEVATDSFYSYLGTIDDHHDELSAETPWSAIHVIGLPMQSVEPDRVSEELGVQVTLTQNEDGGFSIRRAPG